MKTLNEVIAELEDEGLFADALHYLKEYQVVKKVLELKKQQYEELTEAVQKQSQGREARSQAEIALYQEAVRNCEAAELKYRKLAQSLGEVGNKLAQSLGEVGNTEIPPIVSDMTEEEAEAIREEIVNSAELRQKLGAPPVEGM